MSLLRKPVIVCGQKRRTVQMLEVDLHRNQAEFTIVFSIEGLMGRSGKVYSYCLYLNPDLKREFDARCKARWLEDLGMPERNR